MSNAVYLPTCPIPPDNTKIIATFSDTPTDTYGFLLQDAKAKELIVALRGTSDIADAITDINFPLVDYQSPGISGCDGCKVHSGFLKSWNAIAGPVVNAVKQSLQKDSSQKVTVTGHSLGGALASMAAMTLTGSGVPHVQAISYGQPRTGNQAYADYVDRLAPTFIRVTHQNDGIPQVPLVAMGYQHHSTEYWQENTPESTTRCEGQEPRDCINSSPPVGFNGFIITTAHVNYMGMSMGNWPGSAFVCGQPVNPLTLAKTLSDFFMFSHKRSVPFQA
ncbi:hypothetical protein HIM_08882 [Hirsutella minnesotensis 3608]|uniref:Fungal lipase-type domain-containing protein n=1 Tax=Hirsutella minnesotensis 3608 TaxID=1043627 RepID=A0A0F7ZM63_9HYPO|nr:hypothetical protein HIM_08882 [Hirsutella minnesotensis 3608]